MKRQALGMANWVLDKSKRFYSQGDGTRIVRVSSKSAGHFGTTWDLRTLYCDGDWITRSTHHTLDAAKKAALALNRASLKPTNEDRSRIARGKITMAASLLKEARDLLRVFLPDDHGAVHQSGLAYDHALVAESWCKVEAHTDK